MNHLSNAQVTSEIGKLEKVIIHTPGSEVESMTPGTAERALYSDILSLDVVNKEYATFHEVLNKVTQTYQVKDLLTDVLKVGNVRKDITKTICDIEENIARASQCYRVQKTLLGLDDEAFALALIEGIPMVKDSFTKFLSDERFALRPLHNIFFTRDPSVTIFDKVMICRMANAVRDRESFIMQTIFENHPEFKTEVCNPKSHIDFNEELKMEGGDVLIARDDIILVGNGMRTSSHGVDYLISILKGYKDGKKRHIVVQELPDSPESFIHLDMVFTFLDKNQCMVYEPLMLKPSKYRTALITVEGEKVSIQEKYSLLRTLKELGMDLEPITCGGGDQWHQEREQWHSGANFFAFAPGKVIGYRRNKYTADELSKFGYEILDAEDVASGLVNVDDYKKCMVRLRGSELPRGGGGARCMTMPVKRALVEW